MKPENNFNDVQFDMNRELLYNEDYSKYKERLEEAPMNSIDKMIYALDSIEKNEKDVQKKKEWEAMKLELLNKKRGNSK